MCVCGGQLCVSMYDLCRIIGLQKGKVALDLTVAPIGDKRTNNDWFGKDAESLVLCIF